FREWRGVLSVDEAHFTYDWVVGCRVPYGDIWSTRAHSPHHIVFLGLSATIEPRLQTKEVLRQMVFRQGAYHFGKRDYKRHNVDYKRHNVDYKRHNVGFIFRIIQFTSTGHAFRDPDWMVPSPR
ncbi:hypothetical protein FIBSPDRAFT_746408, partial [Athelia psychrophila]